MPIAATNRITAEAYEAMPDDGPSELVRGEVVKRPYNDMLHGVVAATVGSMIHGHVEKHALGVALMGSGFVLQRSPDTVRATDTAFIGNARFREQPIADAYFAGPPDAAIEVVSIFDEQMFIDDKIDDYLAAGCPLVVILNLKRRTATLHRPNADPHVVREPELLDLSPIVDGFRCTLAEIFG